jgi:hypothetical protein
MPFSTNKPLLFSPTKVEITVIMWWKRCKSICFLFLIPIDCFRDGSGLNALKIQKCLSGASFLNLAGRPEASRLETITGQFL